MTTPLVIVGASGFGRETLDVVDAINAADAARGVGATWEVTGVVDDRPSDGDLTLLQARGVAHLGTVEEICEIAPTTYVIGIGDSGVRARIAARLDAAGHVAGTLVHPSASQGFGTTIAAGSIVCAGVRLTNNVRIGRHVHLNLNVTVGHDALLQDFVSVNPLVAVSGCVEIAVGAQIGTCAAILQGISVGEGAVVGASACVVRDVPAQTTVKGVPAR